MQNTFFIWIPSIQKHLLFKELSNSQYRVILKNLNDETNINFIANINRIVEDNCASDYPTNTFTILDRFIILTYFKIQFAGGSLQLKRECDRCGKSSSLFLDLETMLKFLSDKIDKSFRKIITLKDYPVALVCDVPSIGHEFDNLLYNMDNYGKFSEVDMNLDEHFYEYVDSIIVNENVIPLHSKPIPDKNKIIGQLPFTLKDQLSTEFIDPLFQTFDKIIFFRFACSCGEKFELKMSGKNIIEIIKILYKDNSLDSWLRSYVRISKNLDMDGAFLNDLTSIELDIMDQFITESQATESSNDNESSDLFSNYHDEVKGMPMKPSEFN